MPNIIIEAPPDTSENAMKFLLLVAVLSSALFSLPVFAQLGPAGVPGAPGLAETDPSVKPVQPPPAQPVVKANPSVAGKGSQPAKPTQTGKKSRSQANCQATSGKSSQRCMPKPSPKDPCSKETDPARCELHTKAREACKDKPGAAHRQCLRDTLAPQK